MFVILPPPFRDGRGKRGNCDTLFLLSAFQLSIYAYPSLSIPLPCQRCCSFTDFSEFRRRREGGVDEKDKQVGLRQSHLASFESEKLSQDLSSMAASVFSAIVAGEIECLIQEHSTEGSCPGKQNGKRDKDRKQTGPQWYLWGPRLMQQLWGTRKRINLPLCLNCHCSQCNLIPTLPQSNELSKNTIMALGP